MITPIKKGYLPEPKTLGKSSYLKAFEQIISADEVIPENFIPQSIYIHVYGIRPSWCPPQRVFCESLIAQIQASQSYIANTELTKVKIEEGESIEHQSTIKKESSVLKPALESSALELKGTKTDRKLISPPRFGTNSGTNTQESASLIILQAEGSLLKESCFKNGPNLNIEKLDLEFDRQLPTSKHLLELLSKAYSAGCLEGSQINVFKEKVRSIKVRIFENECENFKITLEVSDLEGAKLFAMDSEPFKYQEKLFHNMDKNLLEYFTTKKQLALIKDLSEERLNILRKLNASGNTKFRLKETEKDRVWQQIQQEYAWIEEFFQDLLNSEVFYNYIFSSFITNKTKKFLLQIRKVQNLLKFMKADEKKLFSNDKVSFEEKIKPYMTKADLGISSILGSTAETVFIKQLLKNWEKLKEDEKGLPNMIECSVIGANIHKALWMIINRQEAWRMLRKLVITRLVRLEMIKTDQKKKKTDKELIDDVNSEEDQDEAVSNKLVKKVKIGA